MKDSYVNTNISKESQTDKDDLIVISGVSYQLGYACLNEDLGGFKSYRKSSLKYPLQIKNTIKSNWEKTLSVIEHNIKHNIYSYRLSSNIVPLATLPEFKQFSKSNGFIWWEDEYINKIAKKIRELKKRYDLRLSIHPGQYTVINTENIQVLKKSILDLYYHQTVMQLIDGDDIMLHVGGVYGNKPQAINRWVNIYNQLNPYLKSKIRLENDDKSYTLKDVLEINSRTSVAILFDYHHERCNPGYTQREDYIEGLKRALNSWDIYNIHPKIHLSSGRDGEKDRSHSDWIECKDLVNLIKDVTESEYKGKLTVMLECKKKNKALNRLREEL